MSGLETTHINDEAVDFLIPEQSIEEFKHTQANEESRSSRQVTQEMEGITVSAEPVSVIELTRRQLYDEIWTISAAGVARKYDVPYVQLLTQVKTAGIAIPSSTNWVRLNAGKEVERTEFTGDADEVVLISKEPIHQRKKRDFQSTYALAKGAHQTESKKSAPEAVKVKPTPSENNERLDHIKPAVSIAHQELREPETYQQYGVTYNVYDREPFTTRFGKHL